ncbi:hypothetical protein KBD08_04245 [Candidatus Babeliales bacterium]|nr:hypothetical protein [Candidatus Babeliales bacterium]
MMDRRFIWVFIIVFIFSGVSSLFIWRIFFLERCLEQAQQDQASASCAYEDIDLVMPVAAFLKRGANSANLSTVRRVLVNQWIYYNQPDLIKLVVYGQGAMTYPELKKALMKGIEKEGPSNKAISFVKNSLKIIDENPDLEQHVNNSLKKGFDQKIHELRGRLMSVDQDSKEYRKLKQEYKKRLDLWMNERHGHLLDEIIAKM